MKTLFTLLLALTAFTVGNSFAQAEGWSTVAVPAEVSSGVPFEIKVTAKGAPAGGKIGVDIHHSKIGGKFGGFLAVGPRLDFTGDGEYILKLKLNFKPDVGMLHPVIFLTPDGSFNKHTKLDRSGKIPVAGVEMPKPAPSPAPSPVPSAGDKPAGITFKKSWIHVRPTPESAEAGKDFTVTLDYHLDPSENWGKGTQIKLVPLGPWIDNPDGKYTTKRTHVGYPGMFAKTLPVKPGTGEISFTFKLGETFRYNSILLHALFVMPDGKEWPWRVIESGPEVAHSSEFYDIVIARPGGLFTYDEPVKFSVRFNNGSVAGESKKLNYKTIDASGAETTGSLPFTSGKPGTTVDFTIHPDRRGIHLLETEVNGWGTRDHFFSRIPDVMKLTGGKPTSFGATNIRSDTDAKAARMLGLTYNRLFTGWNKLQPAPDVWKLDGLDAALEASVKNGMKPWLCIQAPPAWVMPDGVFGGGFQPFPFEDAAWRNSISTLSKRYKDKTIGWEWLNEIVPGNQTKTPVEDYLKFCRIGAEEARKVNPDFQLQLAGGLWPANFRVDLLKAGVGKFVDVLPVHYSNLGGVLEARENLDAVGLKSMPVWDNETGSGKSTWDMPSREMLRIENQSQWVLDRWPDELVGGAERIIYFGGSPQAAGNWEYLLDSNTPRPLAATLAVLVSKLEGAKPLGKFFLAGRGVFHLFEKNGKSVLLASSNAEAGEKIVMDLGPQPLIVTDHQGNETILPVSGGKAALDLKPMRVFIEGGDLNLLKRHLMLSVGSSAEPNASPQIVLTKGAAAKVPMIVFNPFDRPLTFTPAIAGKDGWTSGNMSPITLAAGEKRSIEVPIQIPVAVTSGAFQLTATLSGSAGTDISKPFGVTLVSPDMIGNLLKNGGFESDDKSWSYRGAATIVPGEGGLGVGEKSVKFSGTGWSQAIQTIKPPAGQDLLYSAWIWSKGMKQAGSNVSLTTADGKSKNLNIPAIFDAGAQTPFWKLVSKRITVPADLKAATFIPLASGPNHALYDNVRVSLYEGTNYTAEAHQTKQTIIIDGNLTDWKKACPIPLLGDNQLTKHDPSYQWTPENLAGVVYFAWDEKALYLAAEVKDDISSAPSTNDGTQDSDSLTVAIHPANRSPGMDAKAFQYQISTASPGGGSGKNTLYRPASKSGGLSSGQLAKDSSNYDLAIVRNGNTTTYEVKIPWIELGGIQPAFGSKFGLSLELNDNDGKGRAATMAWGEGLSPSWSPRVFGVATLVGE